MYAMVRVASYVMVVYAYVQRRFSPLVRMKSQTTTFCTGLSGALAAAGPGLPPAGTPHSAAGLGGTSSIVTSPPSASD